MRELNYRGHPERQQQATVELPVPGASPATAAGSAAPLRSVCLRDGRALAYAEWGDPAGVPVLEFRGLPSSRLGDGIDVARLVRDGVRRITVDRPGVGSSIRCPVGRCSTGPTTSARSPTPSSWTASGFSARRVGSRMRRLAALRCPAASRARHWSVDWDR